MRAVEDGVARNDNAKSAKDEKWLKSMVYSRTRFNKETMLDGFRVGVKES